MADWNPFDDGGARRVAPTDPSSPDSTQGWSPFDHGARRIAAPPSEQKDTPTSTPETDRAMADLDKLFAPPPPVKHEPGFWDRITQGLHLGAVPGEPLNITGQSVGKPGDIWAGFKGAGGLTSIPGELAENLSPAYGGIQDLTRSYNAFRDVIAGNKTWEEAAKTYFPESQKLVGIEKKPLRERLATGLDIVGRMLLLGGAAHQFAEPPSMPVPKGSFSTTEPPPVQVRPEVAPEIVGGQKFITTKEGQVVPAPEEPVAAKPKPPPETDAQAEARAVGLMKRNRELGGDPEALFENMAKEHGQNPTWQEFADELQDDVNDLSQAKIRPGRETIAQESARRAENIRLAQKETQKLRDQAVREGRDPNTVPIVTPEDVQARWEAYEQVLRERSVQEIEDSDRSHREMAEERKQQKGGKYAKQPGYAQMEEGTAPLGVETRPGGKVTGTGRGDYAVGEAQGTEARGTVRGQPESTGERPMAGAAPGAPKKIIRGGALWEKAKANVNKDLGLSNDPKERMRQLTQSEDPVVSPQELEKMYEFEHNALLRKEAGRPVYKPEPSPPPPEGETAGAAPAEEDPAALRRKAFKKVRDGFYRHKNPESGLVVELNRKTGKWEAKHPKTGEILNKNDSRRKALDANLSGSLEKTVEPPPVEPEVAAATEAAERETRMTEPEMVNVTKHVVSKVKSRGQTGMMTKPQMLEAGREALDAGVDPEWASKTGMLDPEEKYAIVRTHGEDLRSAAHEAYQAYKKNPTAQNKAASDKAFWEYSDWDRYQGHDAKVRAWNKYPGMDTEPDFDPHHFVDMRQQMVKTNQKDFTPKQEAQALKDLEKIKETRHKRVNAMQGYDDALEKLAPDAPDVKTPGQVEAWLNKVMPCD